MSETAWASLATILRARRGRLAGRHRHVRPRLLYHGSAYLTEALQPSFAHTGKLRRWDGTESNHYIYACDSARVAVVMGFVGALNRLGIETCNVRYDSRHRTLRIRPEGGSLREIIQRIRETQPHWFVYALLPDRRWRVVGNARNGLQGEFRRRDSIPAGEIEQLCRVDLVQLRRMCRVRIRWHPL